MSLTFKTLQEKCRQRNDVWSKGKWDTVDSIIEMVEEFGEFASCVKRLRRLQLGVKNDGTQKDDLLAKATDEIGDMGVVLANIANSMGIDLGAAIRYKFNKTSIKYDLPVRIEQEDDDQGQ